MLHKVPTRYSKTNQDTLLPLPSDRPKFSDLIVCDIPSIHLHHTSHRQLARWLYHHQNAVTQGVSNHRFQRTFHKTGWYISLQRFSPSDLLFFWGSGIHHPQSEELLMPQGRSETPDQHNQAEAINRTFSILKQENSMVTKIFGTNTWELR